MILDETIKMKVNGKMVKQYKEYGFDVKPNDIIDLPVKYLSRYSHQKVKCACDVCGEKKEVKYNNYCRYIEKDPDDRYTCKKCNLEKRKKTCLEKYGEDSVAKLESSKIKQKETMKKNGTDFFFRTPEYKEKMMEIYGVENTSQSTEIKEKKIQTCMENYGVKYPSQSTEIKKKQEATLYKNYGVKNPSQSIEIKEKKIRTCMKNYGVKNPSQSIEIHKRQHSGYIRKHHKSGLYYRGTYEKDFIDFSIKNEIEIENFNGYIPYYFEGEDRKYFPDFFIKNENLIIEIKSTYTYEYDLEKNLAKRKAAISNGFNFMFVIDKGYDELFF